MEQSRGATYEYTYKQFFLAFRLVKLQLGLFFTGKGAAGGKSKF
jgi:hypothetical protein